MNAATFVVLMVLVAVIVLIIRGMIRDKKRGKSSCGGNCSACGVGCPHRIGSADSAGARGKV